LTTFFGRIRRLAARARRQGTESGEQNPGPAQTQDNVALTGGTAYSVQDGTMQVHDTGAKTEYRQHIEGGSAGSQGPGATATVHNHGANPGPAGGSAR
jgi:hypothetical protein